MPLEKSLYAAKGTTMTSLHSEAPVDEHVNYQNRLLAPLVKVRGAEEDEWKSNRKLENKQRYVWSW